MQPRAGAGNAGWRGAASRPGGPARPDAGRATLQAGPGGSETGTERITGPRVRSDPVTAIRAGI
jgi:hypothetical protein